MRRSKVGKVETEAALLITGEELHELDRVCAGLVDATEQARQANEILTPDVPDMKARPIPPLQSLRARDAHLGQLLEVMRTSLNAAWRGGDAELRAKLLAHWLHFAYTGALPLLQKKFQLALAIGKRNAATTLEKAFDTIPPLDKTKYPNGWRDIEREANRIATAITPRKFYFDIRKAFMLDAEATAVINGEEKSTGNGDADELHDELQKDLAPDRKRTDAIQYCARLVCHVWNSTEHSSKRKSTNYVFVEAEKGDNLFGVCNRARGLAERWSFSTGTVMTNAANLHATQSGTKHKKRDGMERPETMRQAAKKSRAKEQAE